MSNPTTDGGGGTGPTCPPDPNPKQPTWLKDGSNVYWIVVTLEALVNTGSGCEATADIHSMTPSLTVPGRTINGATDNTPMAAGTTRNQSFSYGTSAPSTAITVSYHLSYTYYDNNNTLQSASGSWSFQLNPP